MAIQYKNLTADRTGRAWSYRAAAFALLLLVAAWSSACYMEGDFFLGPPEEGVFDKSLKVDLPLKLNVSTGSGYIRLVPGSGNEVKVHARVRVKGRDKRDADEILQTIIKDPPVDVFGREVRIGSLEKYNFQRRSISFDFDIEAPEQTEVESRSGSGNQNIEGIQGPVTASCGSGNVVLKDIKNETSAKTGSGRISLYKIRGDLEVGAGSGDILAEEVKGSARARTGSGRITLRSVDGDVSVKTGSGDAEIKGATGNISAHMASGSLRIESALGEGAKWDVVTSSGTVRLLLPANSEFALHARTSSGMLKTDFQLSTSGTMSRKELSGTVGRPKADLTLRTSSGDIRISKM